MRCDPLLNVFMIRLLPSPMWPSLLEVQDRSSERSAPPVSIDRVILPSKSIGCPEINLVPSAGLIMLTELQPTKKNVTRRSNKREKLILSLFGENLYKISDILPPPFLCDQTSAMKRAD